MKYLLDTNIIIDYLRQYQPTIDNVNKRLDTDEDLSISIITIAEVYSGQSTFNVEAIQDIRDIIKYIRKMPITELIAKTAGAIKRDYQTDLVDAIIAATAIVYDMTLITRNLKHFTNIPNLDLLDT